MLIQSPIARDVVNFKTGTVYKLQSLSSEFKVSDDQLNQIVVNANSEPIYSTLFKQRMAGNPYELKDSQRFLTWANEGWVSQTHFVFLLLAGSGEVVGALDIKSANLNESEIGYWLSQNHSGLMTNAVIEVIKIAKDAGYQKLFALIKPENMASQNVLLRAGFSVPQPFAKEDGTPMLRTEMNLA
jgi:RimJ/RimL family protein N-acetyltransferase